MWLEALALGSCLLLALLGQGCAALPDIKVPFAVCVGGEVGLHGGTPEASVALKACIAEGTPLEVCAEVHGGAGDK